MSSLRLGKTIESIRADIFSRIEAVQDEYQAKGWLPARLNLNKGIARGIIELFAWGQWQLYNFLDVIHTQAVPLEASGKWLDLHARQVDAARKPATKARGNVIFRRGESRGNIVIAKGRILRTKPDGLGNIYRYATLEDAVLPMAADSVAVPVEAEEYGQLANATAGQICELATPVPGIASVGNEADWLVSEGADEESDASLARRYILAWQRRAGVTRSAYEAAALEVPGVSDVYVADQHPRGEGTVDVIVMGSAGLPTPGLLDAVRASLDEYIVINHDLLVKSPAPVPVPVRFCLVLLSGDEEAAKLAAGNFVRSLFSANEAVADRFRIGHDVVRDRLARGIISLPGVKSIVWQEPQADVEVPADGLAILQSLDISCVWSREP